MVIQNKWKEYIMNKGPQRQNKYRYQIYNFATHEAIMDKWKEIRHSIPLATPPTRFIITMRLEIIDDVIITKSCEELA